MAALVQAAQFITTPINSQSTLVSLPKPSLVSFHQLSLNPKIRISSFISFVSNTDDLGGGGGTSGGGFSGGGSGGGGEEEDKKKSGMSMSQKLTLGYAALVGAWSYKHHIGRKNFLTMEEQADCDWIWRFVLKLRVQFLPYLQVISFNSGIVKFWRDPWIGQGLILDNVSTYSQRLQAGIPIEAKAMDYIQGLGTLSYSSNQDIRGLWNIFQGQFITSAHRDSYVRSFKAKVHSISVVYKLINNNDTT